MWPTARNALPALLAFAALLVAGCGQSASDVSADSDNDDRTKSAGDERGPAGNESPQTLPPPDGDPQADRETDTDPPVPDTASTPPLPDTTDGDKGGPVLRPPAPDSAGSSSDPPKTDAKVPDPPDETSSDEPPSKFNKVVGVGDQAPKFENLPGADGQTHSLGDYADAKVVVVCFADTLCPVVAANEPRFQAFHEEYAPKGVEFVAISCNRAASDGSDGFAPPDSTAELERIKKRVEAKGLTYDYLYDASQQTGKAYGATATPQLFVLDGDRKIAYMGAFDDSPVQPAGVMQHYVRDAVDALLQGEEVEIAETLQKGCRIEYAN